jgi:hypothetical protein
MWTWRCGVAGSSTGDTCYAPRTLQASLKSTYTAIDAANKLAKLGIIQDYSANPISYRMEQPVMRQEYMGLILQAMNLMPNPSTNLACNNIFTDSTEPWVCRIAETALANNLIIKNTKEDGLAYFR